MTCQGWGPLPGKSLCLEEVEKIMVKAGALVRGILASVVRAKDGGAGLYPSVLNIGWG